jgi:hypothetical protein
MVAIHTALSMGDSCETILATPLCEGEDEWIWKKGKKSLYDQLAGMKRHILFLESQKRRSLIKSKSFLACRE